MTVTVTDRRTVQTEADSTTGWTGASAADTTQYAEATASIGAQINIATAQLYHTGTSRNLGTSPGTLVYVYTWNSAFRLGWQTGCHTLLIGDGTNRIGFHMSGNDKEAFSHSDGPVVWQNFVLDTSLASTLNSIGSTRVTAHSGSFASLNFGAIVDFGAGFITQSKALGGGYNCFVDIIRFGNDGIRITGGTSGAKGTFLEIVTEDRSTATLKAHGVIRELTTKTYGIQSPITFGDSGNATNSYFSDTNASLTYEARDIANDKYYFNVEGNSGATNSFELTNSSIASAGPYVTVTMSNANINTLTLSGVSFIQLGNSITFASSGTTNHNVTNCTFRGCGQVTVGTVAFTRNTITSSTATNGAVVAGNTTMTNMTISGYEGTAGTASLIYNVAADTNTRLDNSSFTKGTAATAAIEFGSSTPSSITLQNVTFSGYNASNGQNDSTFYISDSNTGNSYTINILGGSGNVSYRSAGASVSIVQNPVTATITVVDVTTNSPIENARAIATAANGTGNLPYNDSVTISRVSTTASVSHTAHGLANGKKVLISGANQYEYNGVKTISNVTTNAYDFTVSGTPTTPATGTITSTGVIFEGLTDSNGKISDSRSYSIDQPLTGHARKSTTSPLYKSGAFSGTIDTATGYNQTVSLILDE